jgi:hypothetical protein
MGWAVNTTVLKLSRALLMVSLELVVAAHHYSCFPIFQFLSLLVVVLLLPSVHSNLRKTKFHALCSYVDLAHFGLLCLVIRSYMQAGSCGPWIGVDLIEMLPTIFFSASRATEPRQLLVWGYFVWITFLKSCMLRPISTTAMQVQSCDYHFSYHRHATTRVKDKRLVSKRY